MTRHADNRSIKMISWNIRRPRTNKNQLGEIATKHEADIIALQETHLEVEQRYTLDAYVIQRNDRNIRGETTAVLIKWRLENCVLQTPQDQRTTEATTIQVKLTRSLFQLTHSLITTKGTYQLMPKCEKRILVTDLNAKCLNMEHHGIGPLYVLEIAVTKNCNIPLKLFTVRGESSNHNTAVIEVRHLDDRVPEAQETREANSDKTRHRKDNEEH